MCVVGFARQEYSDDRFQEFIGEGVRDFCGLGFRTGEWYTFAKNIYYVQGDLEVLDDYLRLKLWLERFEGSSGGNRLFYLSVAPRFSEAPSPIWVAQGWGTGMEDGGG